MGAQERKKVAAEGLVIERLTGADVAKPALWDRFYTFYRNTTGAPPGLPSPCSSICNDSAERNAKKNDGND